MNTSGSPQLRKYFSSISFDDRYTNEDADVIYSRNNKKDTVSINRIKVQNIEKIKCKTHNEFELLSDSIYYVDLTRINYEDLKNKLVILSKSKGVVFDLRGRPTQGAHLLLQHLNTFYQLRINIFYTPIITMPNYENVEYKKSSWKGLDISKKPKLQIPIVFLQNEQSISYTETFLSYAINPKDNIVSIGTKTSGANGNTNYFLTNGKYIYFTGLYVTDIKNKCYFSKGLDPTIYCDSNLIDRAIKYIIEK
jgi:C-terminal processing protease CtpA/Prc